MPPWQWLVGWLPDTIMTRSVLIRMRRRNQGESVEPFRRRVHQPDGDRVRQLIEHWVELLPPEITWPELPPAIQDRDADVWEALIVVADLAGGAWPARARAAAVALVAEAKDTEPSMGVRLLADLRTASVLRMRFRPRSSWLHCTPSRKPRGQT